MLPAAPPAGASLIRSAPVPHWASGAGCAPVGAGAGAVGAGPPGPVGVAPEWPVRGPGAEERGAGVVGCTTVGAGCGEVVTGSQARAVTGHVRVAGRAGAGGQ